ncbi:MAG: hypothetical protein KAR79_03005 [Simkaniaceae bacterium]|nr:hypothetical protein [Simkaniaceae bacterium]
MIQTLSSPEYPRAAADKKISELFIKFSLDYRTNSNTYTKTKSCINGETVSLWNQMTTEELREFRSK